MNVIIEVDELVLEGLGPLDGQAVRAAVEQELARLVASGGLGGAASGLIGPGAVSLSFKTASIRIGQLPAQSAAVGGQVAQAIYQGLGQGVGR